MSAGPVEFLMDCGSNCYLAGFITGRMQRQGYCKMLFADSFEVKMTAGEARERVCDHPFFKI